MVSGSQCTNADRITLLVSEARMDLQAWATDVATDINVDVTVVHPAAKQALSYSPAID